LVGCLLRLPLARGGIDELRATALPPQPAFEQSVLGGEPAGAYAGYFKFVPARGESRSIVPDTARWVEAQPGSTGIDLWGVAAATGAQPGAALVVAFDLERTKAGTEYLLLGCGGEAAVLVNDRTVFAFLGGSRSLLRNQDVIELPLVAGRNTMQIVFDRGAWDKIPVDHYAPEWAATLELAKDADSAWSAHAAQVIHPVFDPVVAEFAALRVESSVPGHDMVQLFDLEGTSKAKGVVNRDLTIRWDDGTVLPPTPFAGMLVIGGEMGATILITGSATIDQACAAVESLRPIPQSADPWFLRLRHLLSVNFLRDRGLGWRRNLALVLTMAVADRDQPEVAEVLRRCKAARIESRSYISEIDGTAQYYLLYRCKKAETAPLAVVFPAVTATVRPFLESGPVTNQRGFEMMATVAEQHGVNVLWPGVADVDYGGDLLRREVRECVEAATKALGANWRGGIYGVGQCSSGVAVLGYAQSGHPLQGIVLHNPIVQRTAYRWLPKLPQFPTGYTRAVGEREQVGPGVRGLPRVPVQLIYDIDVPGHGDREGSRALEADLKLAGYEVTAEWPEPLKAMPWGERSKAVSHKWFAWMQAQEAARSKVAAVVVRRPELPAATVKQALLEGFKVEGTADPSLRNWVDGWFRAMARYRAAEPAIRANAATSVALRVLGGEERKPERLLERFTGVAQSGTMGTPVGPVIAQAEALFGFRLVEAQPGANTVEVLRAGAVDAELPNCDLLLDGCCRGALWARRGDRWTLVDFWL
jgi:hypothetical protein